MSSLPPAIPFSALGRRASPPTIARLMTLVLETPGLLSLAAGFTDNATLPKAGVGGLVAGLSLPEANPEPLQYGTNQGRVGLRRILGGRLAALEPSLDPEQLARSTLVTNGSQQALYLAVQVLCDARDIVLVDRPSYFVFLEMLAGLGVQVRTLPTDSNDALELGATAALLEELRRTGEAARVRAVYLVSYFSNPTAQSLSLERKRGLGVLLERHGLRVPVLEDAAYRELYFSTPADAPSVLSLPEWASFPRLYLSTLTKPFATGLKVGFGICTDQTWLEKMLHVKGHHDFGTANFNQAVLEAALRGGEYDRQLSHVRTAYARKMEILHRALEENGLPALGWRWEKPGGGLYLWLRGPAHVDTRLDGTLCRACLGERVIYVPGDLCFGDAAPLNYARLSFGVLNEDQLAEAARRFCRAVRRST